MTVLREWNSSCSPPWSEADLIHKIQSARTASHKFPRAHLVGSALAKPDGDWAGVGEQTFVRPPKSKFCPMVLKRIAGKVEVIANVADFIRLASPVRVDTQDSASVLRRLYRPGSGEKVLIFSGEKPVVVLPGGDVTITDCAAELFGLIAPTKTVFARGGAVVTLTERDDEMLALDILRAAARSLFEKHTPACSRGEPALRASRCSSRRAARRTCPTRFCKLRKRERCFRVWAV